MKQKGITIDSLNFNVSSDNWIKAMVILLGLIIGLCLGLYGLIGQFIPIALASSICLIFAITRRPQVGLFTALFLSFFISGLTRYVSLPWGLGIDILLVIALLALFFKEFKRIQSQHLRNDLFFLASIWMGYIVLQIGNPESYSITAWFYAMRGIGFYQFLIFGLVLLLCREPRYLKTFFHTIIGLSILGALWGLKQKYLGLDTAEDYWLWDLGHHDEHLLFGVLRVFSFYSDAGQFGASQAMIALICAILMFQKNSSPFLKLFYLTGFILTAYGFGISGTRGALAVPAIGGLAFLLISKNFKILIVGTVLMVTAFGLLQYTHVGHSNEQVRRMRSALAPDNPSLQARLNNQRTLGKFLRSRPLGGGVGSAGYWGERFSPHTLLAQTPTDSYYVKIWVETGIIGVCLQALIFGYIVGRGALIVLNTRKESLRFQSMALYCSIVGVLFASYGNQVFSQMPTGYIMSMGIAFLFLVPEYETQLKAE